MHWALFKFYIFDEVDFFFVIWAPIFIVIEGLVFLLRPFFKKKIYSSYWDLSWDHCIGRIGRADNIFDTDALNYDRREHLPDTTIVIPAYVDAERNILLKVIEYYTTVFPETPIILTCNYGRGGEHLSWIENLQKKVGEESITRNKIRILVNEQSDSKPDNLNCAIPHVTTKYVYIVDCGVFVDGRMGQYIHLIESGDYKVLQGIKVYLPKKCKSLYAIWVAHANALSQYTLHRVTSEFFRSGFFVGSNVLLEKSLAESMPWDDSIADDQLYLIKLNHRGHKAIQVPVFAMEDSPQTSSHAFKQQFRWYRANFLLGFRREFWQTRKVFPVNIVWSFVPLIAIPMYFSVMAGKTAQLVMLLHDFNVAKLMTMIILECVIVFFDLLFNLCVSFRPRELASWRHHTAFAFKTVPFDILGHQCWMFFFLVYSLVSLVVPSLRRTWHKPTLQDSA